MKFRSSVGALTLSLCSILLALAASAEVNREALFKHISKALPFPPGVEFELNTLHPSPIPGLLTGTLVGHYKGHTQEWQIQITDNGRYYVLSEVYALTSSKIPGLLSPSDTSTPQIHVAKDASHFVLGDFQDTTLDPDKENLSKINFKGAHFRGTAGAPVAVVEYSDLECPFCRKAHLVLEEKLLAAYGKKIRWYFKHNPLVTVHAWAYPAAIAAACATRMKPEAGWKMESEFFKAQPDPMQPVNVQQAADEKIAGNIRAMSIQFAEKIGLNKDRFTVCYDKQDSKDLVEADRQEAAALRLDSTPGFVINGRIVRGFRDYDDFTTVLDEMLREAAGKTK